MQYKVPYVDGSAPLFVPLVIVTVMLEVLAGVTDKMAGAPEALEPLQLGIKLIFGCAGLMVTLLEHVA